MLDFKKNISIARFFAYILLAVIGMIFFISGCIFLIDPYHIWRKKALGGINAIRLEVPHFSQKGAALLNSVLHTPEVLILGSSRVRRGFNETLATRLYGAKVQVTGIDALSLSAAKDLFFTISKKTHLKKLYLEVNYMTSNDCKASDDAQTGEKNRAYQFYQFYQFSPRDAAMQSVETLRVNLFGLRGFDKYVDQQGRYHDDPSGAASRAKNMEKEEINYNGFFQETASHCKYNPGNAADIQDLTDIFKLAQANNTEVVLLLLPAATTWQARIRKAGLASTIAQWNINVSQLAMQFHATLLDYEQRNDFPATAQAMPLFWDDTHFSNRIGDHLLADMLIR
ncbi:MULTISPECIES: hypothetical protein [unclassified Janthinobacterium]|uniref:hypothetical protein n=1 Tax=unclassified Janthinobacterium TaxID=2610881 RepID=UPI00161C8066|nr:MULTISPECIES: hypothetical protein [unclassified Janthinobacterium]MBB5607401.1 hypothetical protein [Janthinobacterium sp. S3T4]MBB5612422.1 hypothetical protein [Janthinobacterium sp. S3M3]